VKELQLLLMLCLGNANLVIEIENLKWIDQSLLKLVGKVRFPVGSHRRLATCTRARRQWWVQEKAYGVVIRTVLSLTCYKCSIHYESSRVTQACGDSGDGRS